MEEGGEVFDASDHVIGEVQFPQVGESLEGVYAVHLLCLGGAEVQGLGLGWLAAGKLLDCYHLNYISHRGSTPTGGGRNREIGLID